MPTKPSNLVYGVDDPPSWPVSLFMGLQHVCLISISLVIPVLIVRSVGGSSETASQVVNMSLLGAAVGVFLQAWGKYGIGSGYLCPQLCGPSFLTASLLAMKTGGLSLLFGMTCIAGVFEGLFSRIVHKLRALFPAEVTGLIVTMVGLTVVELSVKNALGITVDGPPLQALETVAALFTLPTMVGLNVWSKGKLKLFCIVIGMAAGYALSQMLGILTVNDWLKVVHEPWVAIPFTHHPGWSFSPSLIAPFLIAILCSSLKTVGDLTTCQKINDAAWKLPDMHNIARGVLADGAGCLAAGIFGGMGQSSSSSNIGLSIATGTTSRRVGYALAIILAFLALFPKLGTVFAIMPRPVIGATMIFSVSFMIVAGLQIIMSRMMDARRTFVVGISFILGLSVDVLPHAYAGLPHWLQPIFSSSLSVATISAILLNLIMRIGIAKSATTELVWNDQTWDKLRAFLNTHGGAWGARADVMDKVQAGVFEAVELIATQKAPQSPVSFRLVFDEFRVEAHLEYQGHPIDLQPLDHPSPLIENADPESMAVLMIRHHADNVHAGQKKGRQHIDLSFAH